MPIETRNALRVSGSDEVVSSNIASHPSAQALRAIAPTLLGLSMQSRITRRVDESINDCASRNAGRWNTPIASSGTPRPVTSRRMSAEALNVMPPCFETSAANSFAHLGSHNTTEGLQPASSARRTTRSPSATNIPFDSRLFACAALRCAMVFSCRSRQRNAFSRSSAASLTSIITGI